MSPLISKMSTKFFINPLQLNRFILSSILICTPHCFGITLYISSGFSRENNNIIAVMNLQLDKAAAEKGRALNSPEDTDEQVHKVVQDSVGSGRIGNLKVDPQYLVFEPQSCK